MATNNYWERGRVQGVQKSSALDTLERILGISGGVAENIQRGRDRRSEQFKVRMSSALDMSGNKLPIHQRTFDNDLIAAAKTAFEEQVGPGINRANLETRELYASTLKEMENQIASNTTYNEVDRPFFAEAEDKLLKKVRQYMIDQADPNKNLDKELQDITDDINTYSKKKLLLQQKYGDKLAYDQDIINDMGSFMYTSNKFLSSLKGNQTGDTAIITDNLYNMLVTGYSSNDPKIAHQATQTYDEQRRYEYSSKFSQAQTDIETFNLEHQKDLQKISNWKSTGQPLANYADWDVYETNRGNLHDSYNNYYQVTGNRHIADPLHKGKIEESFTQVKDNFKVDSNTRILYQELQELKVELENAQARNASADELAAITDKMKGAIQSRITDYLGNYRETYYGDKQHDGVTVSSRSFDTVSNRLLSHVLNTVFQ